MIKTVFILAGNYKEAEPYIRNPPPGMENLSLHYIEGRSSLATIPEETRYLTVGTYYLRKDFDAIYQELETRRIRRWGEAPASEDDMRRARTRLRQFVKPEKLTIHQMGKTFPIESDAPWVPIANKDKDPKTLGLETE